ncbi:MAG: arginine repressor [Lachnobacterium sp.]|uniref:arginine repressor n=1 Tax=Agathobacter sp. TaxID=2021311 RepID=UPI0030455EFE|nr:arginine repressor [Lachnobacterium sp.]
MKTRRQAKILELIQRNDVETQEELSAYLVREGFQVTQATVSRDIRELKLTKIAMDNGKQKYAVITDADSGMMEKYARVLREGFISMDLAKNIVVIKTVSGMAGAVCAAIDAMKFQEMVGSIAGDDTIICIIRDDEEAIKIMKKLRKIVGK